MHTASNNETRLSIDEASNITDRQSCTIILGRQAGIMGNYQCVPADTALEILVLDALREREFTLPVKSCIRRGCFALAMAENICDEV